MVKKVVKLGLEGGEGVGIELADDVHDHNGGVGAGVDGNAKICHGGIVARGGCAVTMSAGVAAKRRGGDHGRVAG